MDFARRTSLREAIDPKQMTGSWGEFAVKEMKQLQQQHQHQQQQPQQKEKTGEKKDEDGSRPRVSTIEVAEQLLIDTETEVTVKSEPVQQQTLQSATLVDLLDLYSDTKPTNNEPNDSAVQPQAELSAEQTTTAPAAPPERPVSSASARSGSSTSGKDDDKPVTIALICQTTSSGQQRLVLSEVMLNTA